MKNMEKYETSPIQIVLFIKAKNRRTQVPAN